MALHTIVYMSYATRPFSTDELKDLLHLARDANRNIDVSGLLLYHDGRFLQVVEGEQAVLEDLMGKIEADPRHRRLARLVDKPIEQRMFADWSMGFLDISSEEARGLDGYSNFLSWEDPEDLPDDPLTWLFAFRRFIL